jgi:hypothetical protein
VSSVPGKETDWIADAARAGADLREVIRQAHEATRDLKTARRELEDERDRTKREWTEEVRTLVETAVERQLAELGGQVRETMQKMTAHVIDQFDSLGNILMGEAEDGPSIRQIALAQELARLVVAEHPDLMNQLEEELQREH